MVYLNDGTVVVREIRRRGINMKKIKNYGNYLKVFFASILIYVALVVDLNADLSKSEICQSSSIICNTVLNTIFKVKVMIGIADFSKTILAILIMYFYYKTSDWAIKGKQNIYATLTSIFFTFNMLLGYSYQQINSWDLLFGNMYAIVMSTLVGIGYFILFKRGIQGFFLFLDKSKDFDNKESKGTWYTVVFEKKTKLKIFMIIFICWLPLLILRYPGYLTSDGMQQLRYFFLDAYINGHHPPMHTILLGACVSIGRFLGSDNFGQYIYILLQVIVMIYSFTLIMEYMIKRKITSKYLLITLMFFCFNPVFPMYATTVVKDSLYVGFFTIFVTSLVYFIDAHYDELKDRRLWILLQVSMLSLLIFRKDGAYIVIPTMIGLIVWMYHKKSIFNYRNIHKMILITMGMLGIVLVINKIIFPSMGVTKAGRQEVLSIPFQQTARYVAEYPEDVKKEEADIINNVLDFDNLGKLYNPIASDAVKSTYRGNSSDLIAYFGVWFKHFTRKPLVYVESTLNNNYPMFYVDSREIAYEGLDRIDVDSVGVNIYKDPLIKNMADVVTDVIYFNEYIPIFTLLENLATYTCIFVLLFVNVLRKKRYSHLIIFIPLLMVTLVCIASPSILQHNRYRLPFIGITPLLMCIALLDSKKTIVTEEV